MLKAVHGKNCTLAHHSDRSLTQTWASGFQLRFRLRDTGEALANDNERFLHVLRAEELGGEDGCQVGLEGIQSSLPERLQHLTNILMAIEITADHLSVGDDA